MKTICIQIGNSDDKLPQSVWSGFVEQMRLVIKAYCHHTHFFGGSSTYAPWQNVCYVFECRDSDVQPLKDAIAALGRSYDQDSVAWLEGETEFL